MFSRLADLHFTINVLSQRDSLQLARHARVKSVEVVERTKYVNETYLQIKSLVENKHP